MRVQFTFLWLFLILTFLWVFYGVHLIKMSHMSFYFYFYIYIQLKNKKKRRSFWLFLIKISEKVMIYVVDLIAYTRFPRRDKKIQFLVKQMTLWCVKISLMTLWYVIMSTNDTMIVSSSHHWHYDSDMMTLL